MVTDNDGFCSSQAEPRQRGNLLVQLERTRTAADDVTLPRLFRVLGAKFSNCRASVSVGFSRDFTLMGVTVLPCSTL